MKKFDLKLRQRNISKQDLLADLKRVAEKLDVATITKETYNQYGNFGVTTFLRRFGSWNKALEAGELSVTNRLNISQ